MLASSVMVVRTDTAWCHVCGRLYSQHACTTGLDIAVFSVRYCPGLLLYRRILMATWLSSHGPARQPAVRCCGGLQERMPIVVDVHAHTSSSLTDVAQRTPHCAFTVLLLVLVNCCSLMRLRSSVLCTLCSIRFVHPQRTLLSRAPFVRRPLNISSIRSMASSTRLDIKGSWKPINAKGDIPKGRSSNAVSRALHHRTL